MAKCPKLENPHFSCIFFNMDISLMFAHICLKIVLREACLKSLI